MRKNQLFWGVILLLAGGFMLANEMGIRLPNGMSLMELLWPLALILGGAWVLFGVFLRGKVEVENASIDLQGANSAALKISHGAGELRIHSGANPNELAHGSFAGGLEHKATRNGDRLEVRMKPAKDVMDFPFLGPRTQLDWDVALNSQIPTALTLNVGANKAMLDLRDLNMTDLKLETGASDTRITLPALGRYRADFDLGAASLEVTVPDGLSARIHASIGAASLQVNESRFPRNGSYYQSPGYDSAVNSVDMTIDAGAASIKVM
jgi:hypothetical protein